MRVATIPEEYMEEVRKLQNERKEKEELKRSHQKEIKDHQSNLLHTWRKEIKQLNKNHSNEILQGVSDRSPDIVKKKISTSTKRKIGDKNIIVEIQVYNEE